jgi:hypothetical protein
MRRDHYTLSYTDVCALSLQTLLVALGQTFRLCSVAPALLLRLLLRAAAERRSLSAIVQNARNVPCAETIRQALLACLPEQAADLCAALAQAMLHRLPRRLAGRSHVMAADLHLKPYYGNRRTKGTYRGQRKASTKTFFAYATLFLVHQGQRFTVGLVPVTNGQEQTAILEALLQQAATAGLRPKVLLLDRGFYAATTLRWLQEQNIPFVMPMIRRGRRHAQPARCTGTQGFFVRKRSGWHSYTWTARPRRNGRKNPAVTVTVEVCIAAIRSEKRSRTTNGKQRWQWQVFVCGGIQRAPAAIAELYRCRFSIETSYRQLREGLAATTTKNPAWRLLLVGIALVLRNIWVSLHGERLAKVVRGRRQVQLGRLRLRTLLRWLAYALDEQLGVRLEVTTQHPKPLARCG